jgi:hypothetical protein
MIMSSCGVHAESGDVTEIGDHRRHRACRAPRRAPRLATDISTSYAERANLTMRMHMRRFTRLTNGFSKKVENHAHSMALFTTYYNFVRIHRTLRVTPAMAAGVSARLWEVSDIVALLEASEPKPGKRGPYKKRSSSQAA